MHNLDIFLQKNSILRGSTPAFWEHQWDKFTETVLFYVKLQESFKRLGHAKFGFYSVCFLNNIREIVNQHSEGHMHFHMLSLTTKNKQKKVYFYVNTLMQFKLINNLHNCSKNIFLISNW